MPFPWQIKRSNFKKFVIFNYKTSRPTNSRTNKPAVRQTGRPKN